VQRGGSREQTLSVLVLLVNYLDARLRPEERVCKWNKHSKFEMRLSLHSSAASASGQSTAVTAPLLSRWAARRFSNNGELQKKIERSKDSFRHAHRHPPRVCLGAPSYRSESFLPEDPYPSNARSPAFSLILSPLYFPSSPSSTTMLLSPTYADLAFFLSKLS